MLIEVKFAGIGLHHFLLHATRGRHCWLKVDLADFYTGYPSGDLCLSVNGIKPATFPSQSECVNHYTFVENWIFQKRKSFGIHTTHYQHTPGI